MTTNDIISIFLVGCIVGAGIASAISIGIIMHQRKKIDRHEFFNRTLANWEKRKRNVRL